MTESEFLDGLAARLGDEERRRAEEYRRTEECRREAEERREAETTKETEKASHLLLEILTALSLPADWRHELSHQTLSLQRGSSERAPVPLGFKVGHVSHIWGRRYSANFAAIAIFAKDGAITVNHQLATKQHSWSLGGDLALAAALANELMRR